MFAVEPIRSIMLTDHPYQMPLGFDVKAVRDALMIMRGRQIDVELLFSKKVAAWVKDKLDASQGGLSPERRRATWITLRLRTPASWWNLDVELWRPVRVIRPESLLVKVKDEAKKNFSLVTLDVKYSDLSLSRTRGTLRNNRTVLQVRKGTS